MLKRFSLILLLVATLLFSPLGYVNTYVNAQTNVDSLTVNTYKIFDEDGNLLFERDGVVEGDEYLSKSFKKYKVVSIDHAKCVGLAKFIEYVQKPDVNVDFNAKQISLPKGKICLYMTHNDESYVPTDGVDSVYGKGGIHDVALSFKTQLEQCGVTTHIDQTLHIPHDTKAYARSSITANSMIDSYTPDALFDIHRDGSSRSSYVSRVNGVERCKIRIVVGKASSNYKQAEKFALYLLSVGEQMYDWLFLDIFYASGHYNQGLADKMLLFEMGSHMVEKELVLKSVAPLAEVVSTALFGTTVNDKTGDLTINGQVDENNKLITEALKSEGNDGSFVLSIILAGFIAAGAFVLIGWFVSKKY